MTVIKGINHIHSQRPTKTQLFFTIKYYFLQYKQFTKYINNKNTIHLTQIKMTLEGGKKAKIQKIIYKVKIVKQSIQFLA